jgi:DNA-binding CsgD family transcriptional regulator
MLADDTERRERRAGAEKIFSYLIGRILYASFKETAPSTKGHLTVRQVECLEWASVGKSDWEIGRLLNLSPHTVHRHIEAAKKRLNVTTRVQAVIAAGYRVYGPHPRAEELKDTDVSVAYRAQRS